MRIPKILLLATPALALAASCGNVNSETHYENGAAQSLAKVMAENSDVPTIHEANLAAITSALLERAKQGDVDAALVIFELAALRPALVLPQLSHLLGHLESEPFGSTPPLGTLLCNALPGSGQVGRPGAARCHDPASL